MPSRADMSRLVAPLLLFAVLAVACGGSSSGSSTSSGTSPSTPRPTASPAPSIGYKLAVIDGEDVTSESDPRVVIFNGLLRELASRCANADAEQVADYAVTARRLLAENYRVDITVYAALSALDAATVGATGLDCAEIASTFVVLAGAAGQ